MTSLGEHAQLLQRCVRQRNLLSDLRAFLSQYDPNAVTPHALERRIALVARIDELVDRADGRAAA
jgi:hypothetical protein